ncbi:MAG: hypothetical protein BWY63_03098 [Chloroflexi bacterium ADurb.Bin360]|nr:MAG: hypothetical protein BWY63_03098 [Chloroflexi bacterium ADurb.Bin360]
MITVAEVVLSALAAAEHDLAARTDAGDRDLDVDLVTVERDLARDGRPGKIAAQVVLVGIETEVACRDPECRTGFAVEGTLGFGIVTDAATRERNQRRLGLQFVDPGDALAT